MTVSSTTTKASLSANGTAHSFAYGFKIFADTDLLVIIRSATGTETTKTLNTHYVVTGAGSDSGGNVLFKFNTGNASDAHFSNTDQRPANGETVVILRNLTLTQETDYVANDPFPAESHEDALDRLTMITQQLDEAVGRSLKVSQTNVIATSEFTTSSSDRANKLLSFDGSGDLTVTEGKIDTVTASVSAVSAGGSPTASATYTASSGALALAFGLVTGNTGATGNSAGMQMTFSNSTSDADPGSGKLALNNGTVASVTEMYFDDVDDNGATISTFVQSFDDAVNSTARGIIHIEKEGTPATFALFKVTGAVTNASGYSKVPVGHLASNGSFSNTDGIRVDFSYSGSDGTAGGGLSDVVGDTSPELGGDLDVLARDIVSSSNRDIDLLPNGSGKVNLDGDGSSGGVTISDGLVDIRTGTGSRSQIKLYCESSNAHAQTIQPQPHSAGVTNTLTLPAGGDGTLVSTNAQSTFLKAQVPSTYTAALSATSGVLDYDTYQNFIITLASGSNTLAAPTTEGSQIGQTGVIILIQPSSGSAATLSLHGDYESPAGGTITLSSANSAYDVLPYVVKADNSILLGAPQLAFA
jgi:hypothetical protein